MTALQYTPPNRYTFRAECITDALAFLQAVIGAAHLLPDVSLTRDLFLPDVNGFVATNATLQQLEECATIPEDCHTIARTLAQVG